ncbi:MAG: ankyrin repeat domain-containing protein [Limisphaerales bacterium]
MKTNWLVGSVLLAGAMLLRAQTNDLSAALRQGLFEEEANRNLDAAISNYQTLTTQFDQDRQIAATAIFRLGECYRKLGRTNDAVGQYQRIVREFADQQTLVALSQQNLNALHAVVPPRYIAGPQLPAPAGTFQERLQAIIAKAPPGSTAGTSAELAAKAVELEAEAAQLRMQIEHLSGLNREDARVAVQQNFPNPVLTSLLQQLNEAEQTLATLTNDYTLDNPHVTKATTLVNAINSQIDAQVDGVLKGLQAKMEADLDAAKTLRAQAGSVPSTRSADVTDDEAKEIQRIQQMIQNSPDLINAERGDDAPLYAAAGKGQLRVAGFLLDHGANIEGANHHVPLLAAARNGNRAMVELLLSRGADVNAKEVTGQTPLHIAANKGFQAVVEVLLANKADVNAQDDSGNTPLHLTAGDQVKIIQMLLAAGANPNAENKAGRTPTSFATERGSPEIVKMLLDAKADPNGGKLDAPLFCAIWRGNTNLVELLLRAGANPNQPGNVDWQIQGRGFVSPQGGTLSPLRFAILQNEPEVVNLLLRFKANPNAYDGWGGQPFIFNALSHLDILKALLDAGADPNRPDRIQPNNIAEQGESPLMSVVGNSFFETADGNLAAAKLLIDHGANPNFKNRYGKTALHWAVSVGNLELVKLLLDNKANPNAEDNYGITPLAVAKADQNNGVGTAAGPLRSATGADIADLLRSHGALDNLPHWDCITVSRPSASYSKTVFQKGTNDWNRFTLLETLLNFYPEQSFHQPRFSGSTDSEISLPFPDLKRLTIIRHRQNTTNETRIKVDLLNATNGIDCSRDVPLEFGDVVEIPEREHALGDQPIGLTDSQRDAIVNGLKGSVRLEVQGGNVELPVFPNNSALIGSVLNRPEAQDVLLSSSDLSRVKITRHDPVTGKKREWILDCSHLSKKSNPLFFPRQNDDPHYNAPDLWLRDGDVIEVPEK